MKVEIRAKATETFANDGEEEIVIQKIAPYCDAPQVTTNGDAVIQRFDKASAEKLVSNFQSNIRKLFAMLGFGQSELPIFNGHPDHGELVNEDDYIDNCVYARVRNLEARNDGLWATIEKTPMLAALKNKFSRLEISPRWICASQADGAFYPERLLSLGLVEHGNLPQACTINSKNTQGKDSEMTDTQIQELAKVLGVEAKFDAILDAINASKTTADSKDDEVATQEASDATEATPDATMQAQEETPASEDAPKAEETKAEETPDPRDAKIAELEAENAKLKEATANSQAKAIDDVVKGALTNGKITPAQEKSARAILTSDFVNAKTFIEHLPLASAFSNGSQAVAQVEKAVASEVLPNDKVEAMREYHNLINSTIDMSKGIDLEMAHALIDKTEKGRKLIEIFSK